MNTGAKLVREPQTTPSILGGVPDLLRATLMECIACGNKRLLLSSNSLANKFIFEKWGIRPTQRKRYRNLFSSVRRHCRTLFRYYVHLGRIAWTDNGEQFIFGVYEYDSIRGNLVLSFVKMRY
jgi:hypothetical protein